MKHRTQVRQNVLDIRCDLGPLAADGAPCSWAWGHRPVTLGPTTLEVALVGVGMEVPASKEKAVRT